MATKNFVLFYFGKLLKQFYNGDYISIGIILLCFALNRKLFLSIFS